MKNLYVAIKVVLVFTVLLFLVKGYYHFFKPDMQMITLEDVKEDIETKEKQAENFILDKNDTTIELSDDLVDAIKEENERYEINVQRNEAIKKDLEKSEVITKEDVEAEIKINNYTEDDLMRLMLEENERYREKIAQGKVDGLDTEGNPIAGYK